MNIKSPIAAAAVLFAAGMAMPVAAQQGARPECDLRIDTSSSNWIIRGFDPFSRNEPTASFEVMYRNEGGRACVFRPVFSLDDEGFGLQNQDSPRIPYSLVDLTRGVDVTPVSGRTARRAERGQVTVQPRGQELVRFVLGVPLESLAGDGLFTQNVRLESEGPTGTVLGGRQLTLGIDIIPSAVMGLSGAFKRSGGQAFVDLGVLQDGPVAIPLQLQVRSTRGYQLTFDSANKGQLRLGTTEWTVGYRLSVDGRPLTLSGTGTYTAPRSTSRFDTLPLAFRIDGTENKRAGVYSDTLTISVAAY